ncbi:hypothetical protein D3C74_480030 [compost metagenome]
MIFDQFLNITRLQNAIDLYFFQTFLHVADQLRISNIVQIGQNDIGLGLGA